MIAIRHSNRRAVALVIVLAILMLLSALLVAFMGKVGTERLASKSIAQGVEAKQAYDTAVNLVMSQIRDATRNDGKTAWASQPGVIRTFDDSGADVTVFKLYSHDKMQVKASDYKPNQVDESGVDTTDLNKTPPYFVNINEPVFTPVPGDNSGRMEAHFPIVDPYARQRPDGSEPPRPDEGKIQGFVAANIKHPSKVLDAKGREMLTLPMRVKWLYQLKDGSIEAPNPNTGRIPKADKSNPPVARFAFWTDDESAKINLNTASENTYWDSPHATCRDESGTVDGSGQIVPSPLESALAASQPVAEEYQRFPGHPATTNLSPVLRWMFLPAPTNPPNPIAEAQFKEALYRMLPRVAGGVGSTVGATRNADRDLFPAEEKMRVFDRDRLFATLDDFWFRPDRSPISGPGMYRVFRTTSSAGMADTQFATFSGVTPQVAEQMRFFLTVNSRAPELNLWGKPRVCIWPVHEIDNPDPKLSKRSGFDDLMAFCSTVATKPYIFSRADPWSPSYDYERASTQIRYNNTLYTNANRNKTLMEKYLRELCRKKIPGVGKSLDSKYTGTHPGGFTDMDRILLSIFDYVRSTNVVDTGKKDTSAALYDYRFAYTHAYTTPASSTTRPDYSGNTRPNLGSGQVTPTVRYAGPGEPGIKGFGRFVTLAECGLLFYPDYNPGTLLGDDPLPTDILPNNAQWNGGQVANMNYLPIRCVLISEMFTPSPGFPGLSEGYAYRVAETSPLQVEVVGAAGGATPLRIGQPTLATADFNYVNVDAWRVSDGRFFMSTRGFNNQFWFDSNNCNVGSSFRGGAPFPPAVVPSGTSGGRYAKIFNKGNASGAGGDVDYRKFPFYSKRIWIKLTNGQAPSTFRLQAGGSLTYEFFPLNVPLQNNINPTPIPPAMPGVKLNEPIQRITVNFPAGTFPMPRFQAGQQSFQDRIKTSPSDNGRSWILTGFDTIRTMESNGKAKGDIRLVAGVAQVPADFFATSGTLQEYANSSLTGVHNFRNGWGRTYVGNRSAYIAAGATVRGGNPTANNKVPKVPAVNGSAVAPQENVVGDYDRFVSKHTDGPYINKVDEGNVRFELSDNPGGGNCIPYYRGAGGFEEVGQSYFSPNRMLSSAVMWGSLPTTLAPANPRAWETLLFSPETTATHRGAQDPKDHYLLDLFHMPVVEPYAISEPLSTAGKINLNTHLAPFSYVKVGGRGYIERTTGLHAILKGMKQFVVANGTANALHEEAPYSYTNRTRYNVDPFNTIRSVINPRQDTKYFKTASEICEIDLLLEGLPFTTSSLASRKAFWNQNVMTGDNMRERPYAHIYPRLTTKSNVYTVHVLAQSIAKNPNTKDWESFDDNVDRVTGEYRGSSTIERYIDPNDPKLLRNGNPYDAADSNSTDLDRYYRFRILGTRRFSVK